MKLRDIAFCRIDLNFEFICLGQYLGRYFPGHAPAHIAVPLAVDGHIGRQQVSPYFVLQLVGIYTVCEFERKRLFRLVVLIACNDALNGAHAKIAANIRYADVLQQFLLKP